MGAGWGVGTQEAQGEGNELRTQKSARKSKELRREKE